MNLTAHLCVAAQWLRNTGPIRYAILFYDIVTNVSRKIVAEMLLYCTLLSKKTYMQKMTQSYII
jgi:hypothetical protein